jgi:hypothetical protein
LMMAGRVVYVRVGRSVSLGIKAGFIGFQC